LQVAGDTAPPSTLSPSTLNPDPFPLRLKTGCSLKELIKYLAYPFEGGANG
jgi:hypothetical protein